MAFFTRGKAVRVDSHIILSHRSHGIRPWSFRDIVGVKPVFLDDPVWACPFIMLTISMSLIDGGRERQ